MRCVVEPRHSMGFRDSLGSMVQRKNCIYDIRYIIQRTGVLFFVETSPSVFHFDM